MIELAEPARPRARWTEALRDGAAIGTSGALLSTAVLALLGRRANGSMAAPVNAVSHWLWGDEATVQDRPTLRHTFTGVATQLAASVFWATLYARVIGRKPQAHTVPAALVGGAATSAVAYAIDYTVTPKRLTPGYEYRLDGKGMLAVYAALALGFAGGALLLRGR